MRNLPEAVDDFNLINRVNAWAESAVNTEDLVVDDTAQGEIVEHVGEVMPDCGVAVFPRAFGVEAVRLCNASTFVIAADQMNSVGVSELETYEEADGLYTEEPAIHIVTWCKRQSIFTCFPPFEGVCSTSSMLA